MTIDEYDKSNFLYGKTYLGISRDADLVIVQITVNNTRGRDKKKPLYARIAGLLAKNPGIRPENILVNLLEVQKENCRLATASRNMRQRSFGGVPA